MKELDIIPREQHETSKNYAKRILIHNILTFRLEPGEQFQDKVQSVSMSAGRLYMRLCWNCRISTLSIYFLTKEPLSHR